MVSILIPNYSPPLAGGSAVPAAASHPSPMTDSSFGSFPSPPADGGGTPPGANGATPSPPNSNGQSNGTAAAAAAAATTASPSSGGAVVSSGLDSLTYTQRTLLLRQLLTPRNAYRPGFVTRYELAPLLRRSLTHIHDRVPRIVDDLIAAFPGTAAISEKKWAQARNNIQSQFMGAIQDSEAISEAILVQANQSLRVHESDESSRLMMTTTGSSVAGSIPSTPTAGGSVPGSGSGTTGIGDAALTATINGLATPTATGASASGSGGNSFNLTTASIGSTASASASASTTDVKSSSSGSATKPVLSKQKSSSLAMTATTIHTRHQKSKPSSALAVSVSSALGMNEAEFPIERCALLEVTLAVYLGRTYGAWIEPVLNDWLNKLGVFAGPPLPLPPMAHRKQSGIDGWSHIGKSHPALKKTISFAI